MLNVKSILCRAVHDGLQNTVRMCVTVGCIAAICSMPFYQSAQAKEITIDRTYSVTTVDVPKQCEFDNFKETCARLVNLYARRFEREMVLYKNTNYDYDTLKINLNQERERAVQKVKMSVYSAKPDDPIFTLFTLFEQTMPGQKTNLLVETINFDSSTGKSIEFKQLFKRPELAAMLCARKIEAQYKHLNSPLLPVVISATELTPSNYIITPFGLRFFFAPGLVNQNSNQADSLLVSLDDLKRAQPIEKWWEGKEQVITEEQRKALANSKLAGVIDLKDNTKANPNNQQIQQNTPSGTGLQVAESANQPQKGQHPNRLPKYPQINGTASAQPVRP